MSQSEFLPPSGAGCPPRIAGCCAAWKQYLLVALIALVVVFWRLGAVALEDHESKLAITARTMAQDNPRPWIISADEDYEIPPHTPLNRWMVPVENGRPRLVKTPLPYWVAAGMIRLGIGEEIGARLSSAICAVLLSIVTLWLGRRMMPPRAALLGAIMLATSVGLMKWGRDARPEMILCLWMTVSMSCFWRAWESTSRKGSFLWLLAFWAAMGLANLSKEFVPLLLAWPVLAYVVWRAAFDREGDDRALRLLRVFLIATAGGLAAHLAVSLVPKLHWWNYAGLSPEKGYYLTMAVALGAPMVAFLLAARPWGPVGKLLATSVPGMALMAALFVPWMLYMIHLFPSFAPKVFSGQVTERAAGVGYWTVDARFHVYLLAVLTLTMPWLAFVPGGPAVALMRRFREHRKGLVFLLLWSVGIVLLFTASAAKREHYILPMIPAFCLLMGYAAHDAIFEHKWVTERRTRLLGVSHVVVAIGGVVFLLGVGLLGFLVTKPGPGWLRGAIRWCGGLFGSQEQWFVTLLMVAVAAIPMLVGGVLAGRGRLRPLVPCVAASILLFYGGYWGTISRWDDRRPMKDFAQRIRSMVAPEEELYHWFDPQTKVPYYVGRVTPSLQWTFERQNPPRDGETNSVYGARIQKLSLDWLRENPRRAQWIIGYDVNEKLLAEVGYRPVLRGVGTLDRGLVFVLYERIAAASSAPAGASTSTAPASPATAP